jgi:hypothetical protein
MSIESNYDFDSYKNDVDSCIYTEEDKSTVHYNSDNYRMRVIVDMICKDISTGMRKTVPSTCTRMRMSDTDSYRN